MARTIASIAGVTALIALGACADGAKTLAGRMDAENHVSLEEAVVEVEIGEELSLETGFETVRTIRSESENDVVDLDWASDSG